MEGMPLPFLPTPPAQDISMIHLHWVHTHEPQGSDCEAERQSKPIIVQNFKNCVPWHVPGSKIATITNLFNSVQLKDLHMLI